MGVETSTTIAPESPSFPPSMAMTVSLASMLRSSLYFGKPQSIQLRPVVILGAVGEYLARIHSEDLNGLVDYWRSVLASGELGEIEGRLRVRYAHRRDVRRADSFPIARLHTPIRRLRGNWNVYPRSSAPASQAEALVLCDSGEHTA